MMEEAYDGCKYKNKMLICAIVTYVVFFIKLLFYTNKTWRPQIQTYWFASF